MPRRRSFAHLLALAGMVLGLLVPAAFISSASAATTKDVLSNDEGDFLAIANFNSGYHGFHHGTSNTGINSFDVMERCGDGMVVGLTYIVEGEGTFEWEPEGGDCSRPLVPFRTYGVPTGQAWSEMREVSWYVWARPEGEESPEYEGDFQFDWMGSASYEEQEYFLASSVYNDTVDHPNEDPVEFTTTLSAWPTEETRLGGGAEIDQMWDELLERTPLPDSLTDDQRESMKKQLYCHARWAVHEEVGGQTWDLEAFRPNIPWDQAAGPADVERHRCNWASDDAGYDYPGHGYQPVRPGDEPPADLVPVVNAGPDASGTEGSAVSLDGWAADDHGAPETRWSYEARDGVDSGTTCEFSGAASTETDFTCTDDGEFVVTLTADDGVNPPVSDSAVVTLGNAPPALTLGGPEAWQVYRVGDSVDLQPSFTDPGANDTHTCTVSWDDGTESSFEATDGSCDQGHTFEHAGMYTMEVTVTDDDGGSDTASVMVVVYDPRAGLVTGAGSVDEAAFTTVAKYPASDSTTPLGSVTLTVPTDEGDLTLVSTDLEWLVITPEGESAIKGTAGDYGFVTYATGGHFRAVVWDLSEGNIPPDTLLYDTVPDAGYDIDVAEPSPVSLGVMIIDTGWLPGLPPPVGSIIDGLPL